MILVCWQIFVVSVVVGSGNDELVGGHSVYGLVAGWIFWGSGAGNWWRGDCWSHRSEGQRQ